MNLILVGGTEGAKNLRNRKEDKNMDENMKLIMAEFAKLNVRLIEIDDHISGLDEQMVRVEEELKQVCSRLSMSELNADKAQDDYEKLEACLLTIASDVKNGFYKSKHQFHMIEEQGNAIIKVLGYKGLIPLE